MTEPGGPKLSRENPWPGLVSFSEEDRAYFHGRDAEAGEMARLVRREPLAVLFGRSGLGKTSLLNAGLFPLLRGENFIPVYVRLRFDTDAPLARQILGSLMSACETWRIEAPALLADESLWAYFHRAGASFWNERNRPVVPVLVLDQFEEAFTVGQRTPESRARSAEFIGELGELIENRMPEAVRHTIEADPEGTNRYDPDRRGPKVVLSFREDFLAQMEGLGRQVPSLMRNRYRLQPMNGAQAYAVVTASDAHLVSEDVARRIVGLAWRNIAEPPPDPTDYPGMEVDPALLSVICSELNVRRQRAGRDAISADLLAGADREILSHFYERSFEGLDPRVRAFVENELITERGYRDSFVLEDAVALPGLSQQAIDRLVDRRLLRVDDRLGLRRLELTHDVLTRVVKDSRDSRNAREAELEAAAREAAARKLQWRNQVFGGVLVAGILAVTGAGVAVYRMKQQTDTANERAIRSQGEADTSKERAIRSQKEADIANEDAIQSQHRADSANSAAKKMQELAVTLRAKADADNSNARMLITQAKATDLIINARNIRPQLLDKALLLGAEAIRMYPDRLEAQVDQLGRLLRNPHLAAFLRTDARETSHAYSRDGEMLAAGAADGSVILRSTKTWRVIHRWKPHDGSSVTAVAFSPDSITLASGASGSLALSRLPTGEVLHTQKVDGRTMPVRLVFSPDGATVAVEQRGGIVRVWIPAAGKAEVADEGASGYGCLHFSEDSKTLTVINGKGSIVTWGVAEGNRRVAADPIRDVIGLSSNCRIAAVRKGNPKDGYAVELRNVDGGGAHATLGKLDKSPLRVRFGPGERVLAIEDEQGKVDLWSVERLKRSMRDPVNGVALDDVEFSPDWKTLGYVSKDRKIVVLERNPDGADSYETRDDVVIPLSADRLLFGPDGKSLIVWPSGNYNVAGNYRARVFSIERGNVIKSPDGTPHRSYEVEFDQRGSKLLSAKLEGDEIDLWDLGDLPATSRTLWRGPTLQREPGAKKVEFSPDGSRVAIARGDGSVVVRPSDVSGSSVETRLLPPGSEKVSDLAFSKDNTRLAIGFDDGSFAIYDLASTSQSILPKEKRHEGGTKVAFSPVGKMVASAGADGGVVLWDAGKGMEVGAFTFHHNGAVLKLAFSPDGRRLASGGADGVVALHDVGRRKLAAILEPHEGNVETLVFLEGGKVLLSGAARGSREVWDVAKGRWLTTLRVPEGEGSVALSPDRRQVAVIRDGFVALREWSAVALVDNACRIANRNLTCVEWRQFIGDRPYRKTCEALPGPEEACR